MFTIKQNGICDLLLLFNELLKLARNALPVDLIKGAQVNPFDGSKISKVPVNCRPPKLVAITSTHTDPIVVEVVCTLSNGFGLSEKPVKYLVKPGEGLTIKGLQINELQALLAVVKQ